MKQHIFLLAVATIFAFTFCKTQKKSMPTPISNLPAAWREIDSLERNGLPKSALEKVEVILSKTRTEQNWPERVKALLFRAKFQAQLDENGLTTAISNLKKETDTAAMPEKAVLQSLLAQLYQQYLANKGWQIRQRTDAPDADKTDLDTWAVADFERESQRLYSASLENPAVLKAIQLIDFQEITTASLNDSIGGQPLRPTLFDVLAWRAIEFFKNESNWLTEPAWRFSFDQKEGLAPAREFAFHDFKTEDSTARRWLAVRTFQQILQAHFSDANPATLVDADLARLEFANQNNSRPAEYLNALSVLTRQFGGQPVEAEISLAMASAYFTQSQDESTPPVSHFKMARELAENVVKKWPDSYAAGQCKSLISNILQKELSIQTEEINLPDRPSLALVNFKNTDKICCRIIRFSRDEEADFFKIEEENARLVFLKNQTPFAEFQTTLPTTDDHKNHSTEIRLPALPIGQFALLFADNQSFTGSDEKLFGAGFTRLKISNLAAATRQTAGQTDIIVMNRTTGEPLAGVKAAFFQRGFREGKIFPNLVNDRQKVADGRTNELGIVSCPNLENQSVEVELTSKNDTFDIGQIYNYRWHKQSSFEAPIFTDRAIYRPGQTIFFKSILIEKNGDSKPKILPNEAVEVRFLNANSQEISKLQLSSSEYGSINGSFVSPTGGLSGAFQIQVSLKKTGQFVGYHSVQIEEYKRPKFEVKINPIAGVAKLGDPVTVSGSAMNLAGSAVDGAKVVYRVTRGQKWSPWGGYYRSIWPREPEQQIAQGETTTDADGNFKITFQAQGERGQNWHFSVNADVTDAAGETRSASTSVSISDRLLSIQMDVNELVSLKNMGKLTVFVKNQEGKDVASPVHFSIQAMKPEPFFKERSWGEPEIWSISEADYRRDFPEFRFKSMESKGRQPLNDQLWTADFSSEKPVDLAAAKLKSGIYKFRATTKDANGNLIEAEQEVKIFDKMPPEPEPLFVFSEKNRAEPGEMAAIHVGSNDAGFVLVSIERGGGLKESKWLKTSELQTLNLQIEEADRGNIYLTFLRVRQGRIHVSSASLTVPWTNKDLKIEYETFRDKLTPGAKEEWRLKISGPKKDAVAAEMVAAMYDASLDQFVSHGWPTGNFWPDFQRTVSLNEVGFGTAWPLAFWRQIVQNEGVSRVYRDLNWFNFPFYGNVFIRGSRAGATDFYVDGVRVQNESMNEVVVSASGMGMAAPAMKAMSMTLTAGDSSIDGGAVTIKGSREKSDGPKPAGGPVSPRKNLQETAFFFPELRTDAAGNIVLKFTMGEALTRWKFFSFAHTKGLETAFSEKEIVTQKELMVLPNPPRFLREGDEIEFVSRISNLSQQNLSGTARIELFDALTMKPVSDLFFKDWLVSPLSQKFSVEKGRSAAVAWRLKVPMGRTEPIIWRITATAGSFSDGEENVLPVVTNRMLVTESLVMSVRGGQTKAFDLKNLSENQSRTLKNQQFTLEFTPNPAWYAVQSLPYLMEYPHECSEQLFNRFYANALASSVANSNPKIRAVFDRWKGAGKALASNLSKNQELKSALLEETPWVLAAQNEAQQKQQIALLFDLNKMADEQATALRKLTERQSQDGSFAWFPGGRGDWYITQEIVGGIGHLQKLKAIQLAPASSADGENHPVKAMLERAIGFCDQQMEKSFEQLKKDSKGDEKLMDADHLGSLEIGWLYAHSLFSEDKQARLNRRVFDFYLKQAENHWLKKGLQEQAMLALALHRFGKKEAASNIIASLRERSQQNEELGMYWNFDWGFYWFQLPIETQALLIEAFQDVAGDAQSVENQRVWLLKNKQTTSWKTTKATAAAVYALLISDSKWLDETKPVSIKLGGKTISQTDIQPEAGTGYFKKTWPGEAVKNEMGKVEVSNPNTGLAWGATFWQYFEDMDKVKSFRETPLKLTKQLFKMVKNERGPVLKTGDELHPGDRLTVRIELKVDRPMEYIHLKDSRASGFEPVDVISQFRWQDGLGYYQSTKDLATHFFIDYLPKGVYVFEYQLVVQQRGDFSGGVTTIQSMYAPEFSSHSTGGRVQVN